MIRLALLLAAVLVLTPRAQADVSVQTKYGAVIGSETSDDYVFKGIPYAAPPVGALRFAAPQEPAPWNQPFKANAYGNMCSQYDLITKKVIGNEDCLKLNVWRPKNLTKPLPVMVFIHGGGNTLGAGATVILGDNIYDGSDLSKNGAVVVTINYRLGPMGFLAHKSLETSEGQVGNYAILDQMLALKFVKENIAAFGGDENNVTVFGESAGAIDILVMMASPLSAGLYNRAIIESGFLNDQPKDVAEASGSAFAKSVGCGTASDVAACLRSRPVDMLVNNFATTGGSLLNSAGATDDGVVLKQSVLQSIVSGDYQKVPVIMGNDSQEFRTLGPFVLPEDFILTNNDYLIALTREFGAKAAAAIQAYYPWTSYKLPVLALQAALTDYFALCPARALTRAFVRDTPSTYRYVFSHTAQNPLMKAFGAGHGMEVPYVFGTISHMAYTPSEFNLSARMREYWTTFAASGNPNVAGQAAWPTVQHDDFLNLNLTSQADVNFHGAACDFWAQLNVGQGAAK